MDRLEHIFALQERFDRDLARRRRLPGYGLEEWIQKEVLAMVAELGELLDEVNFKWWKNPHPLDREAIKGELVDILHFLVSMCLKAGITADEFYRAYLAKNEENFKRQQGLTDRQEYAAIGEDKEA
ncbi:dUTPase [Moorella sulfitireducens (nom. illeg.)]|uniref:dUTPase n=1 Tax=Neomoorella sulfitireducens TaxID=2972948 RepID=UPI0021ABFE75|nr:dUTPase [Moorella sulfitireducens]